MLEPNRFSEAVSMEKRKSLEGSKIRETEKQTIHSTKYVKTKALPSFREEIEQGLEKEAGVAVSAISHEHISLPSILH